MRIRETSGVSWSPAPGVRRWRSRSVSTGGISYGLGWLAWWLVIVPFILFPLWLMIELPLAFFTAGFCLALMLWNKMPPEALQFCRAGWFWLFDLRWPPGR